MTHGLNHGLMAAKTRVFYRLQTVFANPNGIRKILKREGRRVVETIQGFDGVLANNIVWQMTVVTFGHMVVSGLNPRVHILFHDVAVYAGLWIVREVGVTFCIDEGVAA